MFTDIDGVFKINAKAGAKLKITFIGYTEQVVVAQNNMRVVLSEDATTLQEVEIVAYGVQKKVTMTGAVASVKTGALTRTSIGSDISNSTDRSTYNKDIGPNHRLAFIVHHSSLNTALLLNDVNSSYSLSLIAESRYQGEREKQGNR